MRNGARRPRRSNCQPPSGDVSGRGEWPPAPFRGRRRRGESSVRHARGRVLTRPTYAGQKVARPQPVVHLSDDGEGSVAGRAGRVSPPAAERSGSPPRSGGPHGKGVERWMEETPWPSKRPIAGKENETPR